MARTILLQPQAAVVRLFARARARPRYKSFLSHFHLHRTAERRCEWKIKIEVRASSRWSWKSLPNKWQEERVWQKKVASAQWQINVNFVRNRKTPHHLFVLHHIFPFIVNPKSIYPLLFFLYFILPPFAVDWCCWWCVWLLPAFTSSIHFKCFSCFSSSLFRWFFAPLTLSLSIVTAKTESQNTKLRLFHFLSDIFIVILSFFFLGFCFYYFVHFSEWKFNFSEFWREICSRVHTIHTHSVSYNPIDTNFVAFFFFRTFTILLVFHSECLCFWSFSFLVWTIFLCWFFANPAPLSLPQSLKLVYIFSFSISLV